MEYISFFILNLLPVITFTGASAYFMGSVYKTKSKYPKTLYVAIWAAFGLGYMFVIKLNLGSAVMSAYGVLGLQLMSLLYGKRPYKIIFTLLFYTYTMIADVISIPVTSILCGVPTSEVVTNPAVRVYTPIVTAVIVFTSVFFIARALYEKERGTLNKKINVLFTLAVLGQFAMMVYGIFLSGIDLISDKFFLMTLVFFIAFDVMGIYLYRLLNIEAQLQQELALSRQKSEMEYEHLEALGREYDRSRKLLHDVKNHLIAIKALGDCAEYVDELTEKMNAGGYKFKCSNRILTVLIGEKIAKAEEENIEFITHIENLDFSFVSDLDWVTILGNIIDNAAEACAHVKDKRKIELFIHKYQKMLVIRLENSIAEKPLQRENGLQSTKEGHMGVGLSSVKDTLAKYDGELTFDFDEKRFKTSVMIPLE